MLCQAFLLLCTLWSAEPCMTAPPFWVGFQQMMGQSNVHGLDICSLKAMYVTCAGSVAEC